MVRFSLTLYRKLNELLPLRIILIMPLFLFRKFSLEKLVIPLPVMQRHRLLTIMLRQVYIPSGLWVIILELNRTRIFRQVKLIRILPFINVKHLMM